VRALDELVTTADKVEATGMDGEAKSREASPSMWNWKSSYTTLRIEPVLQPVHESDE